MIRLLIVVGLIFGAINLIKPEPCNKIGSIATKINWAGYPECNE